MRGAFDRQQSIPQFDPNHHASVLVHEYRPFVSKWRMDYWRLNAPRMRTALTSLCISVPGQWSDLGTEIYGMSKAVLVRGAFALQCRILVPPVWLTGVTAVMHAVIITPP